MKIILSGGGTGGHVYPALAIAEALRKEYAEAEFLYVGVRGRAEEQIVPAQGYSIRYVRGVGFSGNPISLNGLFSAAQLGLGLVQASFILLSFKPRLVIGTGGYASVPAILSAVLLRKLGLLDCRIFIHEQNYSPGRWNRLVGRWVDRVWVSFEGSIRFFNGARAEYTGYPVREQIEPVAKTAARRELGISESARVVLAFGGSQGARTINRALVEALPDILSDPRVEVFHGYGVQRGAAYDAARDNRTRVEALGLESGFLERYHGTDYFHDIQTYYAAADLVICRGGAGTLNEVCRCARPAVIIPKSNLSGEHQVVNSLALARSGAAEVILEHPVLVGERAEARVSTRELASTMRRLLSDDAALERMSQAALKLNVRPNVDSFIRSVREELDGKRLGPAAPPARLEDSASGGEDLTRLAFLSPSRMLTVAQKAASGRIRSEIDSHPLARILRYFADGYLVSRRWQVRNIGVKMAGILRHRERRDSLLEMVSGRKPDRWWKRLAGGDYYQVGFIRRNALTSLAALGIWDERLRTVLLEALQADPYFEVRSEAARAVLSLSDKIGPDEELAAALQANLNHRSPEVRWCCLEAAGAVAPGADSIQNLGDLLYHPNWRIRQALLMALSHMLHRGVVKPGDPILARLDQLIPTCTDFTPTFPLKRALNELKNGSRLSSGMSRDNHLSPESKT